MATISHRRTRTPEKPAPAPAGPSPTRTAKAKAKAKQPPSPVSTCRSHDLAHDSDASFIVRHQAELALSIITFLVFLAGLFPSRFTVSTSHTRTPSLHQHSLPAKFLFLSYEDPTTKRYLKGIDDVAIVTFWVLAFTFMRVALMRYLWRPIATMGGIRKRGQIERFAEQGWIVTFAATSWACGTYILYHSPYSLWDTTTFWRGYPFDALNSLTKLYYLVQIGFWIHQSLAIHAEKRRKDYSQMLAHHCFTTCLLVFSYYCNVTPVGNAILVIMDPADVFLGIAKMMKYLGYSTLCDVGFVAFMLVWVITRHALFMKLLYSTLFQVVQLVPLKWAPSEGLFLTRTTIGAFNVVLAALQILICIWFAMIVRVAVKVVKGDSADDVRSDSEDGDEEEPEPSPRKFASTKKGKPPATPTPSSSSSSSGHSRSGSIGKKRS